MNVSTTGCSSPFGAAVPAAGGTSRASWYLPVLGDACRGGNAGGSVGSGRRSVSASAAAGTRKATVVRLPRTPRPARTLQMFSCVKKGIQDCMRLVEEELTRLRGEDVAVSPSSCQTRLVEVEKQIKQAERHRKRLEFHLFKLEELEDAYILHQQLREGVKTMAKAYISHPGSSKKISMQNVERGHKECVQTLCAIEAQLESQLGAFQCTMAGLAGFARLVPGDTCEMILRYGSQKWKCRGKIGDTSQTWEPKTVSFRALVGEVFVIKVVELKSLGKNVLIGERNCDTKDMFATQPQVHTISLNATGSVKLSLVTNWLPLDGADESLASVEAPRRLLTTPRRQVPVRSMIEGDTDQFLYWQKHNLATGGDSMSNISRYSVPVFPSSPFHAETPAFADKGNESHQDQCQPQQPHQTPDAVDTRRYQQINRLRPHSVCVPSATTRAGSSSSITDSAAVMRRSMSMESLSPRLVSHSSKSFESVINELQSALCVLKNQLPQLMPLADQVDRLTELLKKNAARRVSDASTSIETVLEAFSFLESADYECETVEGDSSDDHLVMDESVEERLHCSRNDLGINSTMTTTDSGIGSIAKRATRDRRSRSDSRILGSRCLSELPIASPSTGDCITSVEQLDVALHWHVRYCRTLAKSLCPTELHSGDCSSAVAELERQTSVLQELQEIAAAKEVHFNELPCVRTSHDRLIDFWKRCCDQSLYCVDTSFTAELCHRCADSLATVHGIAHPDAVFRQALSRVVGVELFRNNAEDDDEYSFLSQTITLHRYLGFFKITNQPSVEDFVDKLAAECDTKSALLPDVIRKTCD